ncbi:MAG: RloB domain-containing protein [Bacteroides sp.]|nr:RloB domain-containing protein [Bacteroides sp.]
MARKIKERKLKNPAITIIGEGATERFYFTHLKRLNGYNYVCKPRNFAEQNIDDIQRQVERVLADEGVAVCVFDVDVTRIHKADKAKFDAMRRRYADNRSVIICDSMPSIEFWFLLHYLNTNRYFASSDDVVTTLHRYLPAFSKQQSYLSKENWVATLLSDNKLTTAINNAIVIGENGESYSNLHKLFALLGN